MWLGLRAKITGNVCNSAKSCEGLLEHHLPGTTSNHSDDITSDFLDQDWIDTDFNVIGVNFDQYNSNRCLLGHVKRRSPYHKRYLYNWNWILLQNTMLVYVTKSIHKCTVYNMLLFANGLSNRCACWLWRASRCWRKNEHLLVCHSWREQEGCRGSVRILNHYIAWDA